MIRFILLATLVLLGGVPASSQSVISNVKSWQEPGTHRIKITYDVAPGSTCTTALQASLDGGSNYDLVIPPAAITADSQLGPGMAGSGRAVEIVASEVFTLDDIFTKNLRFKVVASNIVTHGQMVFIPGGAFQMGDTFSEGDTHELPVHSVYVSGFYLQNTEVTNAQWNEVRAWGLNNGYTNLPKTFWPENHPVTGGMSWYDRVIWCNARSQMEGLTVCYTVDGGQTYKTGNRDDVACNWGANGYRLPTEAEWEKAARGGLSSKRFPWGDTISHSQADYMVYSSNGTTNYYSYDTTPRPPGSVYYYYNTIYSDDRVTGPYSSPVGCFAPNAYGLYDMVGNALEYCWDFFSASYYSSSPETDPHGPASGSYRVIRGGSFVNSSHDCRVADRSLAGTDFHNGDFGFRVARSSIPQ